MRFTALLFAGLTAASAAGASWRIFCILLETDSHARAQVMSKRAYQFHRLRLKWHWEQLGFLIAVGLVFLAISLGMTAAAR